MNDDLARLNQLRASGAITEEQFQHLVKAATTPAAPLQTDRAAPRAAPPRSPSLMGIVGAAAGGALAGSLAADLVQNALADPPPEVLEMNIESTTTLTDDGYVTESDFTVETPDGEVIAEGTYTEEGAWDDGSGAGESETWDDQGGQFDDGGGDFGGMEF